MTTETAQVILVSVTTLASAVWLIGLWFLVASYRTGRTEQLPDHFSHSEQLPKNWFLGSVEVDGQPGALVEQAASLLVRAGSGSLKIVERTADRLAFEQIGLTPLGLPKQGQLRFTSVGSGRTRIDYAVEPPGLRLLLWLGGIFQACGLVALVAGGWAISEYCVPSPDPNIRAQAVQMLQVAHFLWPPFLCGALYRHRRRALTNQFDFLVRNLPHYVG
jgi:hypothetical protein